MTIATFMVPMIGHLKLSISEDMCKNLQATWVARYPKSPFYIGTYEGISTGFRKKFCFITTAVCQSQGKADDCLELTTLRDFRDGYLSQCPDGEALIQEYYQSAPVIVTNIQATSDSDARFAEINNSYIKPCLDDIDQGDLEQCKTRYTTMVRDLQALYM